ncbi:MAG: hypothetical protein EPO19_11050 [Betaproteobacteria bacterium]|nr:MAG: hypothetical protein EPO19_11050 [Betaproteobacteria bacterium]
MPLAVVVGSGILFSLIPTSSENRIRYCGLSLELLGIGAVVFGLEAKRRLFGLKGLWSRLTEAISRFPSWPGKSKMVALSGNSITAGAGTLTAAGLREEARPDLSVEERLSAVEADVLALQKQQSEFTVQIRRQSEATNAAIEAERNAREKDAKNLRSELKELGTGDLHIEAAGVLWLMLGAALATLPSEIARVIQWAL